MMQPNYTHHLFFCTNSRDPENPKGSCGQKCALQLRNYMKTKIKEMAISGTRVNTSGCLDECHKGPVLVVYPEGVWYTINNTKDVDELIEKHIKNGQKVDRLLIDKNIDL